MYAFWDKIDGYQYERKLLETAPMESRDLGQMGDASYYIDQGSAGRGRALFIPGI